MHVVPGEESNIKITYPEDLFLADKIFQIKTVTPDHALTRNPLENKVVAVFGASRGIGEKHYGLGTGKRRGHAWFFTQKRR